MSRPFKLIDVFHSGPRSGNPLAVVLDSRGLTTNAMQDIARWLNYSETTFLAPPTDPAADYSVRIFTLDREMPFAGHPTLGSCHAWLEAGGQPRQPSRIVQQCGAGLINIWRSEGRLAFAAPPLLRSGPVDEALLQEIAAVLRIERARFLDARWVDNGPGWVAVRLSSAAEVLAVEPAHSHAARLDVGLVGAYPPGSACAIELRALFSDQHRRLLEDPVTGSLNASVAQWLISTGQIAAPYVASQGTRLGRAGRVYISQDADRTLWVGGATVTHVTGTFHA